MKSKRITAIDLSISLGLFSADYVCQIIKQMPAIKLYMGTKKSFRYIGRFIALAMLSTPLAILSPAEALPPGVPGDRCGSLSNPKPGTLCYTVTSGGGKVNAGGSAKDFSTVIQATEQEYVIADVITELISDAGDRNLPTINQISPKGVASVVSVAGEKLRELKQIRGELQAKAKALAGPALIEAQTKISALQEEERIYENVVTTTTAAGQDAGKFQVTASARSRKCGFANTDTCGSWVEYNIYAVKRYVGDPIAAYNRAFLVAEDARNTINLLLTTPSPATSTQSAIRLKGIAHIQDIGDVPFQSGEFVGSRGQSRRLEGFQFEMIDQVQGLGIQYMAHIQEVGDTSWSRGGEFVGSRGQSRRLEGFAIQLTGSESANYNVFYKCHVQNIGDTGILSNGQFCGTRGQSLRLEGLQVWIEKR